MSLMALAWDAFGADLNWHTWLTEREMSGRLFFVDKHSSIPHALLEYWCQDSSILMSRKARCSQRGEHQQLQNNKGDQPLLSLLFMWAFFWMSSPFRWSERSKGQTKPFCVSCLIINCKAILAILFSICNLPCWLKPRRHSNLCACTRALTHSCTPRAQNQSCAIIGSNHELTEVIHYLQLW